MDRIHFNTSRPARPKAAQRAEGERRAGRRIHFAANRPGSAALVALVVTGSGLDLGVALRPEREELPPEVMREAARRLAEISEPGDLVVHSPLFGMRELEALGELAAGPDRPPRELSESRRTLVLDLRSSRMLGLGRASEVHALSHGLEIRVIEPSRGGDAVLFELHRDLEAAVLRIERPAGGVSSACDLRREEGGFSCPREPEWLYAAPRVLRVGGEDRLCVWAHPTTGGAWALTLPRQPAPRPGAGLRLTVEGGLTDDAVRATPDGAEVVTEIRQKGRTLGRLHVPNRVGWRSTSVMIDPGEPIELAVTSARDGRRHHCLDARVVEVEGAR